VLGWRCTTATLIPTLAGQETTECHFSIHLPVNQINLEPWLLPLRALALVAIVILWFAFRYYPEKKATERFFDALVAGNTDLAYQLWKPNPTYALKDFLLIGDHRDTGAR